MRHHQHRATFEREVAHHCQHIAHRFRVQRRGWLIEHQQMRVGAQRAGNGDALLFPAGHFRRIGIDAMRQPHLVKQGAGAGFHLRLRFLMHHHRRQHHVLQRGQVRVEVEVLKDHANALAHGTDGAGIALHRLTLKADAPTLDIFQAVYAPQQGGFPGAARPDEADNFPGADIQADPVQNGAAAKALHQPIERQNLGHAMAPTRSDRRPICKRRSSAAPTCEIA